MKRCLKTNMVVVIPCWRVLGMRALGIQTPQYVSRYPVTGFKSSSGESAPLSCISVTHFECGIQQPENADAPKSRRKSICQCSRRLLGVPPHVDTRLRGMTFDDARNRTEVAIDMETTFGQLHPRVLNGELKPKNPYCRLEGRSVNQDFEAADYSLAELK